MYEPSDSDFLLLDRAAIDVDKEQAIERVTQWKDHSAPLALSRIVPIALGIVMVVCCAAAMVTFMRTEKRASPVAITTQIARPDHAIAYASLSPTTERAAMPAINNKPMTVHPLPKLQAHASVKKVRRQDIRATHWKRNIHSWIADPLAGEALRLALIEDHKRTRDLNVAVLASMRSPASN
jgi:hypothetical protein